MLGKLLTCIEFVGIFPLLALLAREDKSPYWGISIMFRHSPSRGHRSKGFKVKDVLQICLLLAVCFWLIYQVKHSHDKKKEFDASDAKISKEIIANSQSGTETIVKLGRKDPKPFDEISIRDEKREEEVEDAEVEGETKHEEEEQEDKNEEKDDERREGGESEIDELDQEKTEEEALREEEIGEEERGKEDEGDDEKEDQMENESATEDDSEHDSISTNTHNHEAREEHYKGDDASSAVAHDGQNVSKGTENSIFENENGNVEADEEPNTNPEKEFDENDLKFKQGKVEMAENSTSHIGITTEGMGIETGLPKPEDSPIQKSIVSTKSSIHPEVVIDNSTHAKMETIGSPLQKKFTQNQDGTVDKGVTAAGEDTGFKIKIRERISNHIGSSVENHSNSINLTKSESADLKSLTSEKTASSDTQGYGSGSSELMKETRLSDTANQATENTNPTLNKKMEITHGAGESEKGSGFSSVNDDGGAIEHDPIDSLDDLSMHQRVKSARIDSDSLLKTKQE